MSDETTANNPQQPTASLNSEINYFGRTNFRNEQRKFGIKTDDRRRHSYIIGKTGMGKTVLLENMAIQDIANGHGMAFVDPHGDTAERLLEYIPPHRINDVIYFNPSDLDFPIAFNPLESVGTDQKHLVASGLMQVFTKIWANMWSARMEYILNNTILALLEVPGNSLLGIMRMLVDKVFRKKIISRVTDPMVKSFWVDEFANYNDRFRQEAIAPIQNKVGQFLSSSIIRNIVGQTKSSMHMRDVMDNQKILIMNLSKGRIGEDASALLGAMMITKLQLAAMSRVNIPEEERKDFYLYVDEFQNFSTESFAEILSEARKYRLCLILAHQYIEQLSDEVKAGVFGNVGTMVSFRVGSEDAEELEKEFTPQFLAADLVNLTKFHIVLKLMIDGVASNPFSAGTLPPMEQGLHYPQNMEKVINVSRERYASPKDIVEEKIVNWLSPESISKDSAAGAVVNEDDELFEHSAEAQMNKKEPNAVCDNCDDPLHIAFEPDDKRNVFCKDCLKDFKAGKIDVAKLPKKNVRKPKKEKPDKMPVEEKPEEKPVLTKATKEPKDQSNSGTSVPKPAAETKKEPQRQETSVKRAKDAVKEPSKPSNGDGKKQIANSASRRPPQIPPKPSELVEQPAVPPQTEISLDNALHQAPVSFSGKRKPKASTPPQAVQPGEVVSFDPSEDN